jgi:tRNA A-37 threonylcarbamoyl transferase component Bud32
MEASGDDEFPFEIERALHFSNAGGVYLAVDRRIRQRVVLREARPLAGLDAECRDAVTRLERSLPIRARLAGLTCVPGVFGRHLVWEHVFLAEEYVPGASLFDEILRRYPYVWAAPSPDQIQQYLDWTGEILAKISAALESLHGRGVALGDLHPANVMVRPDGNVTLIDFEFADDVDAPAPAVGPDGFRGRTARTAAEGDRQALERIAFTMLLPLPQMLDRDPAKAGTLTGVIEEFFPTHRKRLSVPLSTGIAGAAPDSAGDLFGSDAIDHERICDALLLALTSSATPDRADRLFPADPASFRFGGATLAHGAAGVLWAMHHVGAPIPPEFVSWLVRAGQDSQRAPGLYDGAAGIALTLSLLGREDEALSVIELSSKPRGRASVNMFSGRSGVCLATLRMRVAADRPVPETVLEEADQIARMMAADDPALPEKAGLLHGMSGPALLFLRLYQLTDDAGYVTLARLALARDLDRCVYLSDGAYQVRDGSRHLPYLGDGSAGIAVVLAEYGRITGDDLFRTILDGARRACAPRFVAYPGLLSGRAGIIAALSHFADQSDWDLADQHLRRFAWHAVSYAGGLAMPGAFLRRLSMDLATGSAGVLLAVSACAKRAAVPIPAF